MKIFTTKRVQAIVLALVMMAGVVSGLTRMAGALSITSVNPEKGPIFGGQDVMINGNFQIQSIQVTQVSVGYSHTCALDSDGLAYCWGNGASGRLGNNSTLNSSVPVAVNTAGVLAGKVLSQISVGREYTCALDSDGLAYCWGYGASGRLGNNSTSNSSVPVAVNTAGVLAGKVLSQISAGYSHTCALDTLGLAYCWGQGGSGQLGYNSSIGSSVPVAVYTSGVLSGKTLSQISAGYNYTCALDSSGKAYCWGLGSGGYLGNNSTASYSWPVAVNTSGVLAGRTLIWISSGIGHTCVLDTDGQAYCWGVNNYSQLGNNLTSYSLVPVAVDTSGALTGKTLSQISAGHYYTCAIDSIGQAYCWGLNASGQFGNDSTSNSSEPVIVDMSGILVDKTLRRISTSNGILPTDNNHSTCALDTAGQVYCWGDNSQGRLGNNSTANSLTPVCVHTILDGTGSQLPGLGCGRKLTVTFDIDGTPAECVNVVVAADGLSLTCTTTAQVAGWADVTVDDGVTVVTLTDGYEYVENFEDEDKDGDEDEDDDDEDEDRGGGSLIDKLWSPDSGVGKVMGLIAFGEVLFVVAGLAVFFKLKES